MAEIVGTITNLSDFLSKTQVCLSVKPNDPQQQIICLEADRKYSIPAFQREVRWDDNNLKMLLYDLSRSSKFLGNIILTIKSDHTCEIIDGQQRTTVLMLIVSCIKKKFGTKISTPDLCPLRNEGFTGFQTLLEKAFDQEAITSDDWNAILKSDDYLQLPRIQKLWNTISSSELLADRHKAQGLLDNLCKSEFNIIASYSNALNRAERREFFSDAQDSTSCLTALLHFKDTPNVEFSFDVAITTKNKNGNYMRLIHNKNVYALGLDQYTWNEVPNSHQVKDRADKLKRAGLWQKVRDRYLEKKNMYLFRQDHNHPSFVVYVEAVNEVYNRYFNRGGGYSVQSIF